MIDEPLLSINSDTEHYQPPPLINNNNKPNSNLHSIRSGIGHWILQYNDTFRDVAVLGKFILTSLSILLMLQPGHTAFVDCSDWQSPSPSLPSLSKVQIKKLCGPQSDFSILYSLYMFTFILNACVFIFATVMRSKNFFKESFRGFCLIMISIMTLTSLMNIFIIFSINYLQLNFSCPSNPQFVNTICTDKLFYMPYTYINQYYNYTSYATMDCAGNCFLTQPSYFKTLAATLILSFLYFFSLVLSYYAQNVERERKHQNLQDEADTVELVSRFYARHHNLIQDLAAFVKFTLTSVVIYDILSLTPVSCADVILSTIKDTIPGEDLLQYCGPVIVSGVFLSQLFLYTFITNLTTFIIIVFIRHQNAMSHSYKAVTFMIFVTSVGMTAAKISVVFFFAKTKTAFQCYPATLTSNTVIPVGLCRDLTVNQNMTGSYGFMWSSALFQQQVYNEYYIPVWLQTLGNTTFQCSDYCGVNPPQELYSLTAALFFSLLYTLQVATSYFGYNASRKTQ